MERHVIKRFFIFGAIVMPIYVIFMVCSFSGAITTSYGGIALDQNGLLYVGIDDKIDVYDEGEFVRTFHDRKGNSRFRFTIHDEKVYIATGITVLEMDLMGNLIEEKVDAGSKEYNKFNDHRNAFITDDAIYVARGILGYYKVTKYNNNDESEIVFQSPLFEFILQLVAIIGFVSFISIFVVVRAKWYFKEKEKPRRGET